MEALFRLTALSKPKYGAAYHKKLAIFWWKQRRGRSIERQLIGDAYEKFMNNL